MNMEYCYNCDELVKINIQTKKQSIDIKGANIEFMADVAICEHCKEEVYLIELENKRIYKANEIYREKKNIIKISEIEFLLKKYAIGKKPLSRLLGWGENTISRYLNGLTPNIEYSTKLKDLFNPQNMKKLLDKNKNNITDVAIKKVKNSMNLPDEKNINKILQISDCFVRKSNETITPLKLQKLLYYFHAWSLVFFEQVIEEKFEAWVYGPVLPTVYYYYRDYGCKPIKSNNSYKQILKENNYINSLVDSIFMAYGKYEAIFLKELTHKEEPWTKARENIECSTRTNECIENESIKKYYLEEKENYKINDISSLNTYLNKKISIIGL